MTKTQPLDKGGQMEEILREYFLDMGYYVARGQNTSLQETKSPM